MERESIDSPETSIQPLSPSPSLNTDFVRCAGNIIYEDFALKTELVQKFAHEVCLQVASHYARAAIAAETETLRPDLLDRFVEGKVNKWAKKAVLLEQYSTSYARSLVRTLRY